MVVMFPRHRRGMLLVVRLFATMAAGCLGGPEDTDDASDAMPMVDYTQLNAPGATVVDTANGTRVFGFQGSIGPGAAAPWA